MELLRTVMRALFRRRLRTVLTIVGVAVGIFSVTLIGIISSTGSDVINRELSGLGMDGLLVSGGSISAQTLDEIKTTPLPFSAAPLALSYVDVLSHGAYVSTAVWGIDTAIDSVFSFRVLHGRMFSENDIASGRQVCLVDEDFAKESYRRTNIIGKTIEIACDGVWRPFTVVGVIETSGNLLQNMVSGYLPAFLYVPYTSPAIQSDEIRQLAVMPDRQEDTQGTQHRLTQLFGEEVTIHDLAGYKESFNQILHLITAILELIAAISLLVAGLSIMTVMLVSVSERQREIGIKKSIGAGKKRIAAEFFAEAVTLSAIGALCGALLAVLAGFGGCHLLHIKLQVNALSILRNVAFAVAAGGLFGLLPALKAASLPPAEALRQ